MPRNFDEIRLHRAAKSAPLRATDVLVARCFARRLLRMAGSTAQRSFARRYRAARCDRASSPRKRGAYGRPRIHADLKDAGIQVGAKRIARLMKSSAIVGIQPRRFRKTTDSSHGLPVAPNVLARQFDVSEIGAVNRAWAGDISVLQQHGRELGMTRV